MSGGRFLNRLFLRNDGTVVDDLTDEPIGVFLTEGQAEQVKQLVRTSSAAGSPDLSGFRTSRPLAGSDRIRNRRDAAHFLRQVTMAPTKEEIDEAVRVGSRRAFLAKYIYRPEAKRAFPAWDDSVNPPKPLGGWWWAVASRLLVPFGNSSPNFQFPGTQFFNRIVPTAFLADSPARNAIVQAAATANSGTAFLTTSGDEAVRLKATWALAKFLPVSVPGGAVDNNDKAAAIVGWFSTLHRYAFRNYADLLEEITYSMPMSAMLTFAANAKEENGVRPDENYAREIMQLFTIGLYELNLDGTPKLDKNGKTIPTYTQEDILEMAKVFTGLCRIDRPTAEYSEDTPARRLAMATITGLRGDYQRCFYLDMADNANQYHSGETYNSQAPGVPPRLRHYLPFYEYGAKVALGGRINVPAGTDPQTNIRMVIEALLDHPSCAPFVAMNLIRQTVTSNPSPEYVARVASVFRNNGRGVRGDLAAVWMAIWTDPEACETIHTSDRHGRVRDGFELYASIARSFHRHSQMVTGSGNNALYLDGVEIPGPLIGPIYESFRQSEVGDWPFQAPSVFGHYPQDYVAGDLSAWGVVTPELGSKSDRIMLLGPNFAVGTMSHGREPRDPPANSAITPRCSDYAAIFGANYTTAGADAALGIIETCNELLCGGNLAQDKIDYILSIVGSLPVATDTNRQDRVAATIELVTRCPEFLVM